MHTIMPTMPAGCCAFESPVIVLEDKAAVGFELAAGLRAVVIPTGCERMIRCAGNELTERFEWMAKRKYGSHTRHPYCAPIRAKH